MTVVYTLTPLWSCRHCFRQQSSDVSCAGRDHQSAQACAGGLHLWLWADMYATQSFTRHLTLTATFGCPAPVRPLCISVQLACVHVHSSRSLPNWGLLVPTLGAVPCRPSSDSDQLARDRAVLTAAKRYQAARRCPPWQPCAWRAPPSSALPACAHAQQSLPPGQRSAGRAWLTLQTLHGSSDG